MKNEEQSNKIEYDFNNILKVFTSFTTEYYKLIILNTITINSLNFIIKKLGSIRQHTTSILAAFEEMKSSNVSISNNIRKINDEMEKINKVNQDIGEQFEKRNEDIQKISN